MHNLKAFSRAVADTAARLKLDHGDCLYVTSLQHPRDPDSREGTVTHVSAATAAALILDGRARVSTSAEITDFNDRGDRFARSIAQKENGFRFRK